MNTLQENAFQFTPLRKIIECLKTEKTFLVFSYSSASWRISDNAPYDDTRYYVIDIVSERTFLLAALKWHLAVIREELEITKEWRFENKQVLLRHGINSGLYDYAQRFVEGKV